MYRKYMKRLLDILISLTALILLSPVLLVVAVLVRIKLGAPIIFHQDRPGYHEKIFRLYKFRTMTDAHDADGALLPDAVRLTKFGKMLRATSLDEFDWSASASCKLFAILYKGGKSSPYCQTRVDRACTGAWQKFARLGYTVCNRCRIRKKTYIYT